MQTYNKYKSLLTVSFTVSILLPIIMVATFSYIILAHFSESSNNSRLAKKFTIEVLEFNHWKSYLSSENKDDSSNLQEMRERVQKIKFEPSDRVFIKLDGVYKNIEDPEDTVDFSLLSTSNIYADSGMAIKKYKENNDIYISFQQSYGEGLLLISSTRSDNPIYPTLIGRLFVVIGVLVLLVLFGTILTIKGFRNPEDRIKEALTNIRRGDLKKGLISYEEGEEFYQIYDVFNTIVRSENANIDSLSKKSVKLKEDMESLEMSLFAIEKSFESLTKKKAFLESTDKQIEVVINTVVDIIIRIDDEFNILNVNREFEKLMETDNKSVEGSSIFNYISFKNIDINQNNIEEKIKIFKVFLKNRSARKIIVRLKKNSLQFGNEYMLSINSIEDGEGNTVFQVICRTIDNIDEADEFIIRRSYELNQMREINKMLSESDDTEKVIKEIICKIADFSGGDIVTVRLIEGSRLVLKYFEDLRYKITVHDTESFGPELMEKIFSGSGIDLYEGSEELRREPNELIEHILTICKCVRIIPIMHTDERVGIVTISYNSQPEDGLNRTLFSMVGQIGVAIYKNRLYNKQKTEYMNTIKALVAAVEAKDEYTQGHSERVSELSKLVANEMGLDGELIEEIEISGILHDIGKIGIADYILLKPGRLTDDEFGKIKEHPSLGYRIVEPIGLSKPILDGILLHHMRYDKSGYPGSEYLDGELGIVPLIIGAADAFDAITSKRSYSNEESITTAIIELERCSGTQFSPEVVASFRRIYDSNPELIEDICKKNSSWIVKMKE